MKVSGKQNPLFLVGLVIKCLLFAEETFFVSEKKQKTFLNSFRNILFPQLNVACSRKRRVFVIPEQRVFVSSSFECVSLNI